jgi:hypothetical protein
MERLGKRRVLIGGAVAVLAVAAMTVAVLAAGDGGDGQTATATTAPSDVTEPDVTQPPVTEPPGTTAPPAANPVLEDGRHAAFLTGLDVEGRTMELDVVQFLMGQEATDAYHEDHPEDPDAPPNDYYIVNDNPRLRTLAVAADAPITVLDAIRPVSVSWTDLPARLAGNPLPGDDRLWYNPFWLTVEDGVIVAIEEQYTP